MITVAVDVITNRIKYIFDFIFVSNGIEFKFITEGEADIDYRYESGSIYGVSDMLYLETIDSYHIQQDQFHECYCYTFNGITDPIATIFYILTRYEEYLSSALDEHGRFVYSSSKQYEFGILDKSVVDRLVYMVHSKAGVHDPDVRDVKVIPTFDIDNVYAYKLKKGFRRWGAIAKDIVKKDKKRLSERKEVDHGGEDPYDTYPFIMDAVKDNEDSVVFWLSGGNSEYDRNLDIKIEEHAELIRKIATVTNIGLHPSYSSFNSAEKIKEEKERLKGVLGKPVVHSRFHFLHFNLPLSYRALIEAGIFKDYTMGFAGHYGFRAGTSKPFHWFDLEKNEVTELVVYPFVYMDGTLNEYMGLSIEEAKEVVHKLYQEIKVTGGNMYSIWHNETIGDYNHWKGWKEVLSDNLEIDE